MKQHPKSAHDPLWRLQSLPSDHLFDLCLTFGLIYIYLYIYRPYMLVIYSAKEMALYNSGYNLSDFLVRWPWTIPLVTLIRV